MGNNAQAVILRGSHSSALRLAAAFVCADTENAPCLRCAHCRKALRDIHPDIVTVAPQADKSAVTIEQIRGVIRSAHIAPNEADARAFIIDGADTLSAACQNALLKLLEEPPAHTGFILRCEEPGALLPTVRSRCHITASDEPEPFADKRFSELAESFLRAVKRGGSALTVMSFELEKLSREDFAELLSALLSAAASAKRECALSGADAPEYLLRIELVIAAAERYLVHNLSAGHVAAKICAELMPE